MIERVVDDFSSWRDSARDLLRRSVSPREVVWRTKADRQETFSVASFESLPAPAREALVVPRDFVVLAERVSYHRDAQRWSLLYRIAFRLSHGEPHLLRVAVDEDVHRLLVLEKEVRRDTHKMKAFVRFRRVAPVEGEEEHFVAWFVPENPIVRHVAPFFARRFAAMRWSILTPEESAHWDGTELTFGPGAPRRDAPQDDELEELWRRYYQSTFNPARVKIRAMKKEMPVRYWHNLPEARAIAELLRERPQRVETMLETRLPSAAPFVPLTTDWHELRRAAASCEGCPLHGPAQGTVFGEGPVDAAIALVGEQPGDEEDRSGKPFVGPAGRLLDEVLEEVGLPRKEVYVTNAVKHFKYEQVGPRRLHKKPREGEIVACQPWLASELGLVQPRVVVCLGATAARSVLGRLVRIEAERGTPLRSAFCANTLVTYHPAALLRASDADKAAQLRAHLTNDLRAAVQLRGQERGTTGNRS